MFYAAHGTVQHQWLPAMATLFENYTDESLPGMLPGVPIHPNHYPKEDLLRRFDHPGTDHSGLDQWQRNLAATVQFAFTDTFMRMFARIEREVVAERLKYDGVVLTGGSALNILRNELLRKTYSVHLPVLPGDDGLSVGAAWLIRPPSQEGVTLLHQSGPPLFDGPLSMAAAHLANAQPADPVRVAAQLGAGELVAMVRGRADLGVGAGQGRRSVLCLAQHTNAASRLAQYSAAPVYVPLSMLSTIDEAAELFDGYSVLSFGGGFFPELSADIVPDMPKHVQQNGRAHVLTIDAIGDSWLYAVLRELAKLGHHPLVALCPFKRPGAGATVNTIQDALDTWQNAQSIDSLVVDDWLFSEG